MKSKFEDCQHLIKGKCTTKNPRNNRPYRYCTPKCLGKRQNADAEGVS